MSDSERLPWLEEVADVVDALKRLEGDGNAMTGPVGSIEFGCDGYKVAAARWDKGHMGAEGWRLDFSNWGDPL